MGCDIHCYAEIKKNGVWSVVGKVFVDVYYDPDEKDSKWNSPKTDEPYNGRNYNLFAILANVRNGVGFAGVRIGDGFVPISAPKGLPDDLSATLRDDSDDWGCDGHSHSFHTLKTLIDYDWNQTTYEGGFVSTDQYRVFLKKGQPEAWCGGVGGDNVKIINNEDMTKLIESELIESDFDKRFTYYTQVKWKISYKEAASFFIDKSMGTLKKLIDAESLSEDDIRIVFWFDN